MRRLAASMFFSGVFSDNKKKFLVRRLCKGLSFELKGGRR